MPENLRREGDRAFSLQRGDKGFRQIDFRIVDIDLAQPRRIGENIGIERDPRQSSVAFVEVFAGPGPDGDPLLRRPAFLENFHSLEPTLARLFPIFLPIDGPKFGDLATMRRDLHALTALDRAQQAGERAVCFGGGDGAGLHRANVVKTRIFGKAVSLTHPRG